MNIGVVGRRPEHLCLRHFRGDTPASGNRGRGRLYRSAAASHTGAFYIPVMVAARLRCGGGLFSPSGFQTAATRLIRQGHSDFSCRKGRAHRTGAKQALIYCAKFQ